MMSGQSILGGGEALTVMVSFRGMFRRHWPELGVQFFVSVSCLNLGCPLCSEWPEPQRKDCHPMFIHISSWTLVSLLFWSLLAMSFCSLGCQLLMILSNTGKEYPQRAQGNLLFHCVLFPQLDRFLGIQSCYLLFLFCNNLSCEWYDLKESLFSPLSFVVWLTPELPLKLAPYPMMPQC